MNSTTLAPWLGRTVIRIAVVLEDDRRESPVRPGVGDPGARAERRTASPEGLLGGCRGGVDGAIDVGVAVGRRDIPEPARRRVHAAREQRLDEPGMGRRVARPVADVRTTAGSSTAVWTIGPT